MRTIYLFVFLLIVLIVAVVVVIVKASSNNKAQRQQYQDFSGSMVFCQKCGKQLQSGANFCNACGAPVIFPGVENPYNPADAPSGGYSVLCFLFPVIGLILYLVWKDQYPLRARSCGKGAIIGAIAWPVLLIVYYLVVYYAVLGLLL